MPKDYYKASAYLLSCILKSLKRKMMSIFKKLFSNEKSFDQPEGYCPNCWGKQEYQNEIYEAAEKANVNLNNIDLKRGWIQAYAAKHLQKLKLVNKDNKLVCLTCTK